MRRRHLALCSLLALSCVFLGCTDDTTTDDTETTHVDPPTMELVSPAEGACVAIGSDPNVRIPFVLKTSWLYLRPPGVCGEAAQCGQLLLWANDKLVERSSSNVIEWDMFTVIERYGEFKIRIAAFYDTGANILNAEGKPLELTRTITTAVSCPAEP